MTTDAYFDMRNLAPPKCELRGCPVAGCAAPLGKAKSQWGEMPYCPDHSIRIHERTRTFVYYNGSDATSKQNAALRNILFERDYFKEHILRNAAKAETHRICHETSEDAMTWNIFAGLLYYKRLHCIYNQLTGANSSTDQLELFLWGLKIDFRAQELIPCWDRLLEIREVLEPRREIRRFPTEPDIMILGPTHLVCIEAKFTSGNPIALSGKVAEGEKPKSREGLIGRYILGNKLWHRPAITPEELGEKIHSQLLRMIVFTSTMAQQPQLEGRDCIVANLVSTTQWNKINTKLHKDKDFTDPTPSIPARVRNNFRFISWEDDIYENILKHDSALVELSVYMKNKTANLKKAFEISD